MRILLKRAVNCGKARGPRNVVEVKLCSAGQTMLSWGSELTLYLECFSFWSVSNHSPTLFLFLCSLSRQHRAYRATRGMGLIGGANQRLANLFTDSGIWNSSEGVRQAYPSSVVFMEISARLAFRSCWGQSDVHGGRTITRGVTQTTSGFGKPWLSILKLLEG